MAYRISVIMGIYNCATTLQDALDSLFAQTYQEFKIILCDDGSHDETYKIASRIASEHDNIFLLKNDKNRGLNYTLNRCLEYSDTEYVARMDGDDMSLPNRFEKEVAFLDRHPEIAIVSSAMICFDEKGDFKISKVKEYPQAIDLVIGPPFSHPACMIRRTAYKSVSGYTIDKKLLRVEDYHLWFKLYANGFRGHNISEPLYRFRDDRNAITRRNLQNRINEMYVKHIGYEMLGLPWYYHVYTLRPLLIWLLPRPIYTYLHKKSK